RSHGVEVPRMDAQYTGSRRAAETRRLPAIVPGPRSAARTARALALDCGARARSPHLAVSLHPPVRSGLRGDATPVSHSIAAGSRQAAPCPGAPLGDRRLHGSRLLE